MQRALKLHLDFTIHSQLVSGNYFLLVLYKTFCKWKGSVFLEVATKIMFKDKFLAMSVPVEVLFFSDIVCSQCWRLAGLRYFDINSQY